MSQAKMEKTRYPGIYKRPNGKYLARLRVAGKSHSQTFTSIDTARKWLRELHTDLEAGRQVIVGGKAMTAEDAQRAEQRAAGLDVNSLIERFKATGECRIRESYLKPIKEAIGSTLVADLAPSDIRAYLDTQTQGAAPATYNRHRAAIHRLMNYAREIEWRTDNPSSGIKRKREDNRRDRIIDREEQKTLLKACKERDPQLAVIFAFAMATGARAGEITGLTWRHLDLKNGRARLGEGTTKNGKARTLVIVGEALEMLKAHAKVQPMDKDALVFQNSAGGAYDATREFSALADAQGMPDVTLHICRHTWATRLARVTGMTLVMLRDAGGWKSLAMVGRYAHEMTDDLESKLEQMLAAAE